MCVCISLFLKLLVLSVKLRSTHTHTVFCFDYRKKFNYNQYFLKATTIGLQEFKIKAPQMTLEIRNINRIKATYDMFSSIPSFSFLDWWYKFFRGWVKWRILLARVI